MDTPEIDRKCPSCGNINWQVIEVTEDITDRDVRGVVRAWHSIVTVQCQSKLEYDNAPGQWGPCGQVIKQEFDLP